METAGLAPAAAKTVATGADNTTQSATTAERRRRVRECRDRGLTTPEIAVELNLKYLQVWKDLRAMELDTSVAGRWGVTESELQDEIVRLRGENYPVKTIARELRSRGIQICELTVKRKLQDAGLDPSPEALRHDQLTTTEICSLYGVHGRLLRRGVDEGLLPGERFTHGRGHGGIEYRFDSVEIQIALAALPHCDYLGCDRPVLIAGELCRYHVLARTGSRSRSTSEREVYRSRLAAAWRNGTGAALARVHRASASTRRARHRGWIGQVFGPGGGRPLGKLSYWNEEKLPVVETERASFLEKHGRPPTLRELEKLTGVPRSTLPRLLAKLSH